MRAPSTQGNVAGLLLYFPFRFQHPVPKLFPRYYNLSAQVDFVVVPRSTAAAKSIPVHRPSNRIKTTVCSRVKVRTDTRRIWSGVAFMAAMTDPVSTLLYSWE